MSWRHQVTRWGWLIAILAGILTALFAPVRYGTEVALFAAGLGLGVLLLTVGQHRRRDRR